MTANLQKRTAPKRLSLVIPIYNEIETLPHLRAALDTWRATVPYELECILVDDGSYDGSLSFIENWASEDRSICVIGFSRNFGHQLAVTAGLCHVAGDAVVILDADLQDPLEAIPDMVEQYTRGYDIVYGIRDKREGETLMKRMTAWAFYRFMRLMIHRDLPADTGDFRLLSAHCVSVVNSMPERDRFIRGLCAWTGLPQVGIRYTRKARLYGESKYPLVKMLRFAGNAIISFSPLPIRCISVLGALVALLGFSYGLYATGRWLLVGDTVAGWSSIIVLVCLIGGMILLSVGIVGEYISRIYESVQQRPQYIIKRRLNLPPEL